MATDFRPLRTYGSTSVSILCAAWNHATSPSRAMTDREHKRASAHARAIRGHLARIGYQLGRDYRELSSGALWPKRDTLKPDRQAAQPGSYVARNLHAGTRVVVASDGAVTFPGPGAVICPTCGDERFLAFRYIRPRGARRLACYIECRGCGLSHDLSILGN